MVWIFLFLFRSISCFVVLKSPAKLGTPPFKTRQTPQGERLEYQSYLGNAGQIVLHSLEVLTVQPICVSSCWVPRWTKDQWCKNDANPKPLDVWFINIFFALFPKGLSLLLSTLMNKFLSMARTSSQLTVGVRWARWTLTFSLWLRMPTQPWQGVCLFGWGFFSREVRGKEDGMYILLYNGDNIRKCTDQMGNVPCRVRN